MAGSTLGRLVVDVQTNKSGGPVAYGDVVISDASNDHSFTTTTSAGLTSSVIGVVIEPNGIANNATGRVQFQGYCAQVNCNASVTRGYFLKTHTVAKQAAGSSSRVVGAFGVTLKTSATPDAYLWGLPDATAATGNVAGDPIWDAAGDLAVGSGADTAARLAIGSAGGALSVINSTVAWNSGTSMPANKATGDRYWRTDLGLEAYWDGTRWLTTTLYHLPIPVISSGGDVFSSTDGARYRAAVWNAVYNLYLVDWYAMSYVASGNSGSAYWTPTLYSETKAAAYATSSIASFSTGTTPDTSAQFTVHTVSINALLGTGNGTLLVGAAKTSTPGNLTLASSVTYRLVLT